MSRISCPYCDKPARLVRGNAIYPTRPDLFHKRFWQCAPCGAYVGCHQNTDKPLGRLANTVLRAAKIAAHASFDPLWKSGELSRTEAYLWLAAKLNISAANCHIGMMDVEDCKRVMAACAERRHDGNIE